MYKILILMFLTICLSSCSSKPIGFGLDEEIAYNGFIIDNYNENTIKKSSANLSRSKEENCFRANGIDDNDNREIITVRFSDRNKAINHFYRNKATWNIKKRKMKNNPEIIEMYAETETQIKYEVAYCYFQTVANMFFKDYIDFHYISLRLIKE